jgi:SMC interacting uncharacterized protein involved in chromosome segregation
MPKALPPPPTNAAETRALLAAEVCKTTPDISKLKALQTLLTSFEEEDRRKADAITKTADDALREKEVEASLKASTEWREAQTILIRKEVEDEQIAQRFDEKQRQTKLQSENTRLQEQVRTAQQANTDQQEELARLRSTLTEAREHLATLRTDNENLAAQLAPVEIAVLEKEIEELQAARLTETDSGVQLYNIKRSQLLHTQIQRIRTGEVLHSFQADLEKMTKPESHAEFERRIDADIKALMAAPPLTFEERQRQDHQALELIARLESDRV